ncbi:MAG: hypothetical protein E7610_05295 [Ruminococcaceae bacterium]|nr:hypothetical protein [Oscillospiraceae bacterium]
MKKNTNNRFLIGSWVSFYPFDTDSYEFQLDQMSRAGINFNIFPMVFGEKTDTPEICEFIEQQYAARDMLYFMNGGSNDDELWQKVVSFTQNKEHCIGYYIGDEPSGMAIPETGRRVRVLREEDVDRYPFVNLLPSYAGEHILGGSYYDYCSRFVREAGAENIEYLSHDFYPFCMNRTNLDFFADLEVIRRVAWENGRLRTHAFPQSSAWNGMRMPNIHEMRWNAYAYLAYGFKALSWFNLVCPGSSDTEGEGFRDSIIYRDGTIRDKRLFEDFSRLNQELRTVGETLMKLNTVHAYHTTECIAGVEILPPNWLIAPVKNGDFIISHMVSSMGDETYVMIFNKDWRSPVTASFRIMEYSGIESVEYVSPFNGSTYPITVQNGVFTETFRPGEGKLYKLNGKISYRVLPLNSEKSRADIDLSATSTLVGFDIVCPMQNDITTVTVRISTNKKFTEDKTTVHQFDAFPANGRIHFSPTVGKYARITFSTASNAFTDGYAEIRVRFADEPDTQEEPLAKTSFSPIAGINYSDLDEAFAVVEGLIESEYSPESWQAVQNCYKSALTMKNAPHTQEDVTAAYWQLLEHIRELEPVQWTLPQSELPSQETNRHGLHVTKGILSAAVVTVAGAVAGSIARFFTSRKKK